MDFSKSNYILIIIQSVLCIIQYFKGQELETYTTKDVLRCI